MKINVLILAFFLWLSSCKNNACDITDYKNGEWHTIDTIFSYKVCSQSEEKLKPDDSIRIEFLGTLKEQQNIIIQTDENLALFTLFNNVRFGKFTVKEIKSNSDINKILPLISKNSECLLKYKFRDLQLPEVNNIISVYFKRETDTNEIIKFNRRISSLNFVDSIEYISSDAAIKKWAEENDSTWNSFLKNNPLPTSTCIYIKKGYYNSSLKDSISVKLSAENIISEIVFPNDISSELWSFSNSLQFPFFIKISTW